MEFPSLPATASYMDGDLQRGQKAMLHRFTILH
jgi:hypothetical protein